MKRNRLLGAIVSLLLTTFVVPALADTVIFNSIPSPLPGNVVSKGFECCQIREFGDGIVVPTGSSGGTLAGVTVIMSSWACVSGNWFNAGTCNTPKGAKFAQPITMNIYEVDNSNPAQPKAGALLGSLTQTFQIPYRPSSDTIHCPDGEHWYDSATGQCFHGIASPITFDFTQKKITLPNQIVVGIAFNTSTAGPNPIGTSAACHSTPQGCPYDSLNVSADGVVFSPSAASVIDPNGVFVNYISLAAGSCNPASPTGVLADDTLPYGTPGAQNCWTGYHPALRIEAKCDKDHGQRCPAVIGAKKDDD